MFALADCNNFFASCERTFNPRLNGKPVVILSNNDGCVIARSNEAKALGIKMGAPWHIHAQQFRRLGVAVLSSNYMLYGDMSARVMAVLRSFTPTLEIYSIDECFLDLSGMPTDGLLSYCQEARQRVLQWTGIPIGIGVAPTKTLAKIANHLAKKNPVYGGVCVLATNAVQEDALAHLDLSDIWGVGSRLAASLNQLGINTALQMREVEPALLRRNFNVIVERIGLELRGVSCLSLEMVNPQKKSLISSRSFGQFITRLPEMRQAISTYICRGAAKLRAQGLVTSQLVIYLRTNSFNFTAPQYHPSIAISLDAGTADSRKLVKAALTGLESIWRPGYRYKKAGVVFNNLHPPEKMQLSVFSAADDPKAVRLMQAIDKLNLTHGPQALALASSGFKPAWALKANHRSPSYTTEWQEIFTAMAN